MKPRDMIVSKNHFFIWCLIDDSVDPKGKPNFHKKMIFANNHISRFPYLSRSHTYFLAKTYMEFFFYSG